MLVCESAFNQCVFAARYKRMLSYACIVTSFLLWAICCAAGHPLFPTTGAMLKPDNATQILVVRTVLVRDSDHEHAPAA